MQSEMDPLPQNVNELITLVQTQHGELRAQRKELHSQQARLEHQSQFIDQLLEQIRLSRHQHFGSRSERFSLDQMALVFNEAEATAQDVGSSGDTSDADQADGHNEIVVAAHRRAKGGRRPLPPELPRVEVIHELDKAGCACAQCQSTMTPIGQKTCER